MSGVTFREESVVDPWDVPDIAPSDTDDQHITVGSVVRHKRFGIGKVQRIIRRTRGSTVTVDFRSGVKHLVLEYAKLEVVSPDSSIEF